MWRKRSFALGFCLLPHAWSLDTDPLCHNDSCLKPLDICSLRIVISSQGLTVFSLQEVSGKSNCEIKQDLIPGSKQRRVELFTKRDSQQKKLEDHWRLKLGSSCTLTEGGSCRRYYKRLRCWPNSITWGFRQPHVSSGKKWHRISFEMWDKWRRFHDCEFKWACNRAHALYI